MMRRLRTVTLCLGPFLALLASASPALAITYGGEGLYGPTTGVAITNVMFILLGFFPTIIIVFSLIQAWLDRRKHHKMDEEAAARAANPVKTGW
jgi:preprotein translocase subunit SecG